MGERSEPTGIGAERRLSLRGWTEPAPYQGNRSSAVYGGVRSPRPTEAPTGRCGHRPLRIEGEATSTTWGSGAERSVCGADGRNEEESEQRSPPKGPATPDNPSVSLRGTGDADCHVGPAGLLAMIMVFCHSEASAYTGRGNPSFFTMDGGSGRRGRRPLRPAGDGGTARRGRRALRVVAGRSHQLSGQRLAKRKARKEQLVKFGLCPMTSERSTAYWVRKSDESPARALVGAALIEQDSLGPHPAARQGAPRP